MDTYDTIRICIYVFAIIILNLPSNTDCSIGIDMLEETPINKVIANHNNFNYGSNGDSITLKRTEQKDFDIRHDVSQFSVGAEETKKAGIPGFNITTNNLDEIDLLTKTELCNGSQDQMEILKEINEIKCTNRLGSDAQNSQTLGPFEKGYANIVYDENYEKDEESMNLKTRQEGSPNDEIEYNVASLNAEVQRKLNELEEIHDEARLWANKLVDFDGDEKAILQIQEMLLRGIDAVDLVYSDDKDLIRQEKRRVIVYIQSQIDELNSRKPKMLI